MTSLIAFIEQHQAAFEVAGLWFMRELPIVWKKTVSMLVSVYPYCRDNGGVDQIVKSFFSGKPKTP